MDQSKRPKIFRVIKSVMLKHTCSRGLALITSKSESKTAYLQHPSSYSGCFHLPPHTLECGSFFPFARSTINLIESHLPASYVSGGKRHWNVGCCMISVPSVECSLKQTEIWLQFILYLLCIPSFRYSARGSYASESPTIES